MSHRNARLTVHGRLLIVRRHQQGWRQAHIAAAMGVSRKCVKIWIDRYAAEGEAGLEDRSSRPRSSPTRTAEQVERQVLTVRDRERRGQDWIGPELGVPARTVSRILRRHHKPYLRELDPISGDLIRSSKSTATRYERERPGELVHVDVKKLGRIPDGGGWKANGRQKGQTGAQKRARIGYDYIHSMVDDHSRLAYSEVLPDETASTSAEFLLRAAAYFAAHGISCIERVITDNAFVYRHSHAFAAAV
ncbi:leucine zipper domain-containing protein, partial [Rathayibacter sp. YIM 133350]|uniref:helix-turn-helix domain-containing protein n=1 Tax=Rathayibacter sp. YIM 133350 TaxID=3131992 RepID=UPI00307EB71A